MNELTQEIKIAILRVLQDIILADNIVRDKEVEYRDNVAKDFGLADNYMEQVNQTVTLQSLSLIRELPQEQKTEIAKLMGNMIIIDEDINYNEVKLYNTICESCNIQKDFNEEEYPEYIHSGMADYL